MSQSPQNDDQDDIYDENGEVVEIFELENDENGVEFDENDDISMDSRENGRESPAGSDEIPDDSILAFAKHSDEVFSVDLRSNLAVSGAKDDKAYVWDVQTGEIKLECSGHKDSVTWVRFNSSGTKLATGDMSGLVQIWDLSSQTLGTSFDNANDLEWLQWHKTADILLAGDSDGMIWMWLVPNNNCKTFAATGATCTSGYLLPSGRQLLAGYEDSQVRLWDLKDAQSTQISGASSQTGPITCLDAQTDGPMAASGSEDGSAAVFNMETGKIVSILQCEQPPSEDSNSAVSVETVQFSANDQSVLATATVTGKLDIWDLGSGQRRQSCPHPDAVTKFQWLNQHEILSACVDGALRVWDVRNAQILRELTGHHRPIFDFKLAETGLVVTAGADGICRVFDLAN